MSVRRSCYLTNWKLLALSIIWQTHQILILLYYSLLQSNFFTVSISYTLTQICGTVIFGVFSETARQFWLSVYNVCKGQKGIHYNETFNTKKQRLYLAVPYRNIYEDCGGFWTIFFNWVLLTMPCFWYLQPRLSYHLKIERCEKNILMIKKKLLLLVLF